MTRFTNTATVMCKCLFLEMVDKKGFLKRFPVNNLLP